PRRYWMVVQGGLEHPSWRGSGSSRIGFDSKAVVAAIGTSAGIRSSAPSFGWTCGRAATGSGRNRHPAGGTDGHRFVADREALAGRCPREPPPSMRHERRTGALRWPPEDLSVIVVRRNSATRRTCSKCPKQRSHDVDKSRSMIPGNGEAL